MKTKGAHFGSLIPTFQYTILIYIINTRFDYPEIAIVAKAQQRAPIQANLNRTHRNTTHRTHRERLVECDIGVDLLFNFSWLTRRQLDMVVWRL